MIFKLLTRFFQLIQYPFYVLRYQISFGHLNGYGIKLQGDGRILFGEGSYISFGSYVNSSKGYKVDVGQNTSIGHNVTIYTSGLDLLQFTTEGKRSKTFGDVVIGSNCFIGSGVFIGPGVTIGEGSIIGANVVLTKSVKSRSIVSQENVIITL